MSETTLGGHAAGGVCRLALADGTIILGRAFGATGRGIRQAAEVVFNTSMTGYQESMTDPSYTGQILVLTAPLIGNVGVNEEDVESGGVAIAGLVCRELARRHSNFRSTADLDAYLRDNGVLAMQRVDTRALTRRLRAEGVMMGVLSDDPEATDAELVELARTAPSMAGANLAEGVGCTSESDWAEGLGFWSSYPEAESGGPVVLAVDCGAKHNTLRHLVSRGCRVRKVPFDFDAHEVIRRFEAGEVHGLFISNGPGDPEAVEQVIASLRKLLSDDAPRIPILGICLGHQLLALASGARSFKLAFGHRGSNQPVRDNRTGKIEITSQNHGFAIDADSLDPSTCEITHIHLNDGTLAGFQRSDRPVWGVQYHPEASPGPHDSWYVYEAFVEAARGGACLDGSG